jgi:hypothetical protein
MKVETLMESIDRQARAHGKRSGYLAKDYWDKIQRSHQVLAAFKHSTEYLDKLSLEDRTSAFDEALKNLTINVASAFEIFVKDFIKIVCDKPGFPRDEQGIRKIMDEKITLGEAYELFNFEQFSIGNLVSLSKSFLDLTNTITILNQIVAPNFIQEIEEFVVTVTPGEYGLYGNIPFSLSSRFPNWQTQISKLLSERHEYVHQSSYEINISYEEITSVIEIVGVLIKAVQQKFNFV